MIGWRDELSNQPVVSIIIPAYQAEQHLHEAIESVLKQSTTHEIVVVNDGSSDRTQQVAESYAGVRLLNKPNQGAGSARALGLLHSSAPLVMFLDADDRLRPSALQDLSAPLRSDQSIDFTFGRQKAFSEGADIGRYDLRSTDDRAAPTPSSTMIRRSFLSKMGELDPSNHSWILWVTKARANVAIELAVDEVVCDRRLRSGSISTSTSNPGTLLARAIAQSRADRRSSSHE
jgi:glycosyltransferase involved in cell wall biosynthesis